MTKHITLLITCLLVSVLTFGQDRRVAGLVKDNKGSGIPGASIKVKGSNKGVVADKDGHFAIEVGANSTLVFSSIGYLPQEQLVGSRTMIDVTLAEDSRQLTDVVVVGYGTRQKKDVTGAVSSVKTAQLEMEHPTSVTDQIRGNIPGISVSMNTSAKGGGTGDMLVRGKTTLTANTSPLIVLDGVIYYGQLQDINPNDIQSIDVLKDASALAVYGAKAATGVVAITTKRGKSGKPTISLNTNWGIAELESNQRVYGPQGFLDWRADVMRSTNTNNPYWQYSDPRHLPDSVSVDEWMARTNASGDPVEQWLSRLGLVANEIANYKAGKTIDWANAVFRKGLRQDHTISLSGRKDETVYYMSLNFTDNQNLIEGGEYKNVRARLNLESAATKWLTVGMNVQFARRDEGAIEADWTQITNNSPYGDFYDTTGALRRIPTDDAGLNARNPFLDNHYNDRMNIQTTIFTNLFGKVTLPFGITYQVNFTPGFDAYRIFNHGSDANPNVTIPGGTATREMEERYTWQVDNLLKWNHTFAKVHNVDITLLANAEKYQSWYSYMYNEGFNPNDQLGWHNIGAGNNPSESSDDRYYTGDALMGRLNYSYKDRYLLTASVRRDGYSAFGQRYPRATFPALALGWIFTEEQFVKKLNLDWLNYGKLRLSYGVNGNRDLRNSGGTVNPYAAVATVATDKYPVIAPDGSVTAGSQLWVSVMANKDLKWEQTESYNIGLDLSLFGNRLDASFDAYSKKTNDLLVSRNLPAMSGFDNVMTNIGEVDNKGFEISLSSRNIVDGPIKWNTGVTFALNRNEIKHLYGLAPTMDDKGNIVMKENNDTKNGWFIGKDIDAVWDYKIKGVWQSDEAATAKLYSAVPGDFKLEKEVNDGPNQYKYTDADKQFLGSKAPRFTWSLRNEFNIYNNFDFSFLLTSNVGQLKAFNQAKNSPGSVGFGRSTSYVMPYWTPNNPINDYARLNSGFSGTSFTVYRKNSFVRLSSISLGYNLPKYLLQSAKIQNVKVYVNMTNAYVYAPTWNYWDPQNDGPTPRYITAGLNVTF